MFPSASTIRIIACLVAAGAAGSSALAVDIYTSDQAKQQVEQQRQAQTGSPGVAQQLKKRLLHPFAKSQNPAATSAPGQPDDAAGKALPTQGVQTPVAQSIHGSLAGQPAPLAPAKAQAVDKGKTDNRSSDKSKTTQSSPERRGKAPCITWLNNDVPTKAVLLCVHGLGLHNESYKTFGESMAAIGVPTYACDVRGFGSWMKSPQDKVVDFPWCLQDIHDTLKVLHRVYPNKPIFILGESMGGAIALRATAMYPDMVDGLISCVPSGDRFKQGRTELRIAWRILHGINTPFDIGTSVVKQASQARDEKNGTNADLEQDWLEDKLNRKELSPRELMQFQKFMNENHEWAKQIKDRPVLMIQGGADALVKANGTLELLLNIPLANQEDVDLLVIRKAKHLIFEESEFNDKAFNARVVRLVNGWIGDHLTKPDTAMTQAPQAP